MYYTCPRRLGTIRSSPARGMRHRHMMILKSVTFTMTTVGEPEVHLRLSSYGSQIYVCVRESWARSMRTCALALRVQVRHKYMLSTCEKPIVICVQLLMKQGGDCVMHVMAATVLSVVKAPLGELGLDPSTWKSVHRAKRERAVRSV